MQNGSPIVLVHGAFQSAHTWDLVVAGGPRPRRPSARAADE
jgi:hypothetical protein